MGKDHELLNAVDESKRSLLRKILTAGAAIYVAPTIASFSLSESFTGTAMAEGGNQGFFLCHPLGANQGTVVPPTPGHRTHGDHPTFGVPGDDCEP